MKTILTSALIVVALTLTSFTLSKETSPFKNFGFYLGSNPDNSPVSLKINEDHTYLLCDYTNMKKSIKVTGKWVQDGNQILLQGNDEIKFHNTWKMDTDCACLKSKKGLTYYRLCQK